jgi:hypothetical protein
MKHHKAVNSLLLIDFRVERSQVTDFLSLARRDLLAEEYFRRMEAK